MRRGQVEADVVALITQLPCLPQPWNIDDLCNRLAQRRRRPIMVHPLDLPALPFGLWYDDGKRDHIIYRVGVSGYYRDHVILHEICHLLARHNAVDYQVSGRNGRPGANSSVLGLVEYAMSNRYTSIQEELAEAFAARVLMLAKRNLVEPLSTFEQRAAARFGTAR